MVHLHEVKGPVIGKLKKSDSWSFWKSANIEMKKKIEYSNSGTKVFFLLVISNKTVFKYWIGCILSLLVNNYLLNYGDHDIVQGSHESYMKKG